MLLVARAECGAAFGLLQSIQALYRLQVPRHGHPLHAGVANHVLDAPHRIQSVSHLVFAPSAAHWRHQVKSAQSRSTTTGAGQFGHGRLRGVRVRPPACGASLPPIVDQVDGLALTVEQLLHGYCHCANQPTTVDRDDYTGPGSEALRRISKSSGWLLRRGT